MDYSLPKQLLPLSLLFLSIINAGCSSHVIHQDVVSSMPRVAVVADEHRGERSLIAPYRQAIAAINNRLRAKNFEVVNIAAVERMADDEGVLRDQADELKRSNLVRRHGVDALIFVSFDIVAKSRDAEGLCRVRLSLDCWGIDGRGADLGVSFAKTSVASKQSCDGALLAAARELGYFAGNAIAGGLVKGKGKNEDHDEKDDSDGRKEAGFD